MPPALIDVRWEDIEEGEPRSRWRCPVALAIAAVWEEPVRVKVMPAVLRVWPASGDTWWAPPPPQVRLFVARFDFDIEVRPMRFMPVWRWERGRWAA